MDCTKHWRHIGFVLLVLTLACASKQAPMEGSSLKDPDLFDTSSRNLAPEPQLSLPPQGAFEGEAVVVRVDPHDPDSDRFTFLYDWDGNGVFDDVSSNAQMRHVYPQNGTYLLIVRVQDDHANSVDTQQKIIVKDRQPTAAFTIDGDLKEGVWIHFDAKSSSSPSDAIVKYEWDWDYNGKQFRPAATQGERVENRWLKDGRVNVALRVTDSDGSASIVSKQVQIADQAPVAKIVGPSSLMVGESALFSGQESHSVVDKLRNFEWDTKFDDNGFINRSKLNRSSLRLSWKQPGRYVIALRVTDEDGSSAIAKHVIEVKAPKEAKESVKAKSVVPKKRKATSKKGVK